MIVRGPGIQPGTRALGNVYLLDALATLTELAKIETPKSSEGKSFVPVLRGEDTKVRDTLYGVYCGGTKPGMRSVRKGDWKLIKYDVMDGAVQETQLFNLAKNPHEFLEQHHSEKVVSLTSQTPNKSQTDLAELPEYQDKLVEMEALLLSEMERLNDPHRFWDQPQPEQPND